MQAASIPLPPTGNGQLLSLRSSSSMDYARDNIIVCRIRNRDAKRERVELQRFWFEALNESIKVVVETEHTVHTVAFN